MKEVKPTADEIDQLITLFNSGRHVELETRARLLTKQHPNFGFAWKALSVSLQIQGKDALSAFQKSAELLPDDQEAHYNLGKALRDIGQLEGAAASYRRALEINPGDAVVHNNLGITLKNLGQLDEAAASYRRALKIKPDYAEAHSNLGNTLMGLKQVLEAEANLRRALEIKPDSAEALNNLALFLSEQGRLSEAEISLRQALEIKPNYIDVHSKLSYVLYKKGLFSEAETSLRHVLKIKPDFAAAHSNLGKLLAELGRLTEAEASLHRALEIKPDLAEAHGNMGNALCDLGQLDDAVASYRRALEIEPDYAKMYSNLLFALNYHPDLGAEEIYRAYQEYDTQWYPLRSAWRTHGNDKNPDRRLRVGYVSPDFRHHSCRYFLEPLLAHHDKMRVEVYAYAELFNEDHMTARYKRYVEHWVPTKGMSDEALAERIRHDGIDILVELAGHTAGNRLLAFARKPAPVSVSWLGYGYTTGIGAIDYYLTDATCVPIGSEGLFAEHPWRMATPAYAYRPTKGMGEAGSLPAQQRGYITFGTLTRSVRINHSTIRVWSEILHAAPNSRLVIDSLNFKEPAMQERMASKFAEHGINRERLEIGFHSPPWDVLRGIDIGLDCFPHNSGTTLFETLYMGVPYVTLAGRPSVGRLGSSILRGAGHPEWIAGNEDEYIAKAVELAGDTGRLSKIRSALRGQMETGPLRDEAGFSRKVEEAYRGMWQKWCDQ